MTIAGRGHALRTGLGMALAHRAFLTVWLALIWLTLGERLKIPVSLHVDPIADLPSLSTSTEQSLLGVWRRWDASHYLNLAQNGYRASDPGPTVFGPLAPAGIRLADWLAPGGLDIGGIVFATAAVSIALIFLHSVVASAFCSDHFARWTVRATAILPLSFYLAAPMSEAAYLACALGLFSFGLSGRWVLAAICGGLAVLARSQGILLLVVGVVLALEQTPPDVPIFNRIRIAGARAWPVVLIPFPWLIFHLYRESLGLAPINDIYRTRSFIFFTDPITGLYTNFRWIVMHPLEALANPDSWALVITLGLTALLIRDTFASRLASRKIQPGESAGSPGRSTIPEELLCRTRPSFVVYTVIHLAVFVSKLNWQWGSSDTILYTQSLARYSLALFPLTIWVTARIMHARRSLQLLTIGTSVTLLLILSAFFALGGGAP